MKFHSTDYFKPTREFNADDVLFTFERMLDKDHPFRKAYPTEFPYFTDMGLDKNIARHRRCRGWFLVKWFQWNHPVRRRR